MSSVSRVLLSALVGGLVAGLAAAFSMSIGLEWSTARWVAAIAAALAVGGVNLLVHRRSDKNARKAAAESNAIGFVAIALVSLIAANIIGSRVYKRLDFTEDHVYTLSAASRQLVADLPDRITVKAFISKTLPAGFGPIAQYTRDILDEYAASSKGKFVWESLDPSGDSKLEEQATKFKVNKVRRGSASSDQLSLSSGYFGVAFQYQGNIESIPEINGVEGLEFQMTSIIKMLTVKKKKVAFAIDHGELNPDGNPQQTHGTLANARQLMADYDVVTVSLNQGQKPIPDDADALVIAGPKAALNERAKFVVDQFLMKGKAVAFLVSGMLVEAPRQQMQLPGQEGQPRLGRKNDTGLDDLLESYGFKLHDDIVMEPRQNVPGPVAVANQLYLVNSPVFIGVTKFADKSSITDKLKVAVMPFASSLDYLKDKQPGLEVTQLMTSSPQSWRQGGFFLFDPERQQLKPGEDHGPFALGFSAKGKLKSFYAGKPYPNEKGELVQPPAADVSPAPGAETVLTESTGTPRLIVIGCGDFASDEYIRFARALPLYGANLLLFINVLDFLVADETLAPLRAKTVAARPVQVNKESTPALVKYANVIGVPLLFALYGLLRRQTRLSRRRSARL